MGAWHREHPELIGTGADPWMMHRSYRIAGGYEHATPEHDDDYVACEECGFSEVDPDFTGPDGRSVCDACRDLDHAEREAL